METLSLRALTRKIGEADKLLEEFRIGYPMFDFKLETHKIEISTNQLSNGSLIKLSSFIPICDADMKTLIEQQIDILSNCVSLIEQG